MPLISANSLAQTSVDETKNDATWRRDMKYKGLFSLEYSKGLIYFGCAARFDFLVYQLC
jgi:hypothetical protein